MKKRFLIIMGIILSSISLVMGCGKSTSHSSNMGMTTEVEVELDESIPDTAEELLIDAVDNSIVPEEELTPSGELTNAIISATYITVMEDRGDSCKLRITYPDVKTAFLEAIQTLPETADEEQMNDFYRQLVVMVENQEVSTLETTLELDILRDEEGRKYLDWTMEAMSATTGGLSDVFYDEIEKY